MIALAGRLLIISLGCGQYDSLRFRPLATVSTQIPATPPRAMSTATKTHHSGLSLLAFIVGVFVIAGSGAIFSPGAWFAGLTKPPLNPPNWVFAPVWSILYVLMAVAAWLVWRERGTRDVRLALTAFAVQLLFNACWTPLFFGLHSPLAALVDILLLWPALALTLWLFYRLLPAAGLLLAPYLAWVSFATYLNFMFWRLNA